MAKANPATAVVPKELADLAEKFILQATVQPVVSMEDWGDVVLQVLVHPFVNTSGYIDVRKIHIPTINFYGGRGSRASVPPIYSIGVGNEPKGKGAFIVVDCLREDKSSLISPLKAEYRKVLGMRMPGGAPAEGPHSKVEELFRHVPGSLEDIAQVAFTTIKEHTQPVLLPSHMIYS